MTTPDVRAFYKALGIELPGWPKLEAPVRCFAQPDAHNHSDRSPSCSVNLASGAWNCHGCGAHGGAYDAALARPHATVSDRSDDRQRPRRAPGGGRTQATRQGQPSHFAPLSRRWRRRFAQRCGPTTSM